MHMTPDKMLIDADGAQKSDSASFNSLGSADRPAITPQFVRRDPQDEAQRARLHK